MVNPTVAQREKSDLDLIIAATSDAVMMVEAGAKQVGERLVLDAIGEAHEAIRTLTQFQEDLRRECGKPKWEFTPAQIDPAVEEAVDAELGERLAAVLNQADKAARETALDALSNEVVAKLADRFDAAQVVSVVESRIKKAVRRQILNQNRRLDGRDTATVRPIACEVGVLPRTHGSALFTRGQTQALSIATLGPPGDAQQIETLAWEDEHKRYLHHYNFPPYGTGRDGAPGGPLPALHRPRPPLRAGPAAGAAGARTTSPTPSASSRRSSPPTAPPPWPPSAAARCP